VDRVLKDITPRSQDFSQWYVDVVTKADLIDYAPVKGFTVLKPYGYRIWELIQGFMDGRFKATGHQNAYFPVLIPESLLKREAEHVEGFAPEVAWVTRGGAEELSEPLAVRPTSEAVIGAMYSRWVQSYRDLPILINQWCSVVRWEKATRPFLRAREFLWQEGHTAHRTEAEAMAETEQMLGVYRRTIEGELAIPCLAGPKTPGERFAGAVDTLTLEGLMGDGRALQLGTSHFLGQNFARAFDIGFLDEDGVRRYCWTTSWGTSYRLIGAIIMLHGDDRGLRLPPAVAPVQVVVVPIGRGAERDQVTAEALRIKEELAPLRVTVDERPEYTPGWKYNDWEMRGVPVRLELGPRDLAAGTVVAARRDTGEKVTIPRGEIAGPSGAVARLLDEIQHNLYHQALSFRDSMSFSVKDLADIQQHGSRGFFWGHWCGSAECEERVKQETGATIRCLPFDAEGGPSGAEPGEGPCVACGKPSGPRAVYARAY
jgi:prolyl-tRNA synthetase